MVDDQLASPAASTENTSPPPPFPFSLTPTLKQYIGVFGNPANKVAGGDAGESIAMTAPVVTGDPTPDSGKMGHAAVARFFFPPLLLARFRTTHDL